MKSKKKGRPHNGPENQSIGLRLGINRTWDSRWFANTGEYGKLLHEDLKIRKYLDERTEAGRDLQGGHRASAQEVPRHHPCCASRRLIIGKKGADIEKLRKKLSEMTNSETHLNIVEVRKPEIDATLVAQSIASSWSAVLPSAAP